MLKQKYSDEEDLEQAVDIDYMAGELQEMIFSMENTEPSDKRKMSYKIWKKEINELFKEYNSKFGKMYAIIK
jgi:trehalose-6-phosphate synthase